MELISVRMIRGDLDDIPRFELPAPYRLRLYRAGDEDAWVDIHERADRYNEASPELFRGQFGTDEALLGRRQYYLLDGGGSPVGTATAWFDDDFRSGRWGRVHWVAIVPEHQGKGLAKPLLSRVCLRLRELGHRRAYLTTQTPRIPAISLYLKFGFEPEVRTCRDVRAWRLVRERVEHPALEGI